MAVFMFIIAFLIQCGHCARSGSDDVDVDALSHRKSFTVHGPGRNVASLLETTAHTERKVNSTRVRPPRSGILPTSFSQLSSGDLSDQMRMSVVRIHSIVKPVDWFHPYYPAGNQESIGSGFAVEAEAGKPDPHDPIFMTNAHVVRNAHTVQIQLPTLSQSTFDAYVPLIYEDFDLAIVRLFHPEDFAKAIEAENKSLTVLKVAQSHVNLGLEVLAVGFPLGSSSLKLSRGVIAGTEQVHGGVCYQSTAPISPGNSGGPLFSLGSVAGEAAKGSGASDLTVIGVNFAASVSQGAENVNYVIPIVHLQQALTEYKRISVQMKADQQHAKDLVDKIQKKVEEDAPGSKIVINNGQMGIIEPDGTSPEVTKKVQSDVAEIIKKDQAASGGNSSFLQEGNQTLGPDGANGKNDGKTNAGQIDSDSGDVQTNDGNPGKQTGDKETDNPVQDPQKAVQQQPQAPPQHHRLRVAPIDMMGTEGNDALYKDSGGCTKGIYISKIAEKSALQHAVDEQKKPSPVPEHAFLTAVNGVPLDSYGMGRTNGFLTDPLPFESIMGVSPSLEDPVKLTVCQKGQETQHIISMAWKDSYESAIKVVTEPYFESDALDYEHFADISIMQMTQNHLISLLQHGAATLGRWLLPEDQSKPRLVVVDVKSGSYASRNIMPGMVVDKVNGKEVNTLADYRKVFEPANNAEFWTLETDRGILIQEQFNETLKRQTTLALQVPEFRYLITPAIKEAEMKRAQADQEKMNQLAGHEAEIQKQLEALKKAQMQQLQQEKAAKHASDRQQKQKRRLVSSKQTKKEIVSLSELGPLLEQVAAASAKAEVPLQQAAFSGGISSEPAIAPLSAASFGGGSLPTYTNSQDATFSNIRLAQPVGFGNPSQPVDGLLNDQPYSSFRLRKDLI